MTVVIAYDIASDARRIRLAASLESRGHRLQESVFQLRLETEELALVREEIGGIIDQDDDVVHIFPLCETCLGRREVHGTVPTPDDGGLYRGVW